MERFRALVRRSLGDGSNSEDALLSLFNKMQLDYNSLPLLTQADIQNEATYGGDVPSLAVRLALLTVVNRAQKERDEAAARAAASSTTRAAAHATVSDADVYRDVNRRHQVSVANLRAYLKTHRLLERFDHKSERSENEPANHNERLGTRGRLAPLRPALREPRGPPGSVAPRSTTPPALLRAKTRPQQHTHPMT